jgi:hypothetical protein
MSTQNRIHNTKTNKNGESITEGVNLKWLSFINVFSEILYKVIKNKTKKIKCYFVIKFEVAI